MGCALHVRMVIITSAEVAKGLDDNRSGTAEGSRCETCDSPVDLTTSVLMKGYRVVGCPACDWITPVACPPWTTSLST